MIKYDQWYYFPTKRDKEKFLEKVIPELYFYMSKEKLDELFVLFMEKELIKIAPDKTLRFRTNRSNRYEELEAIAYKDTADSTLEKENNDNQENSKMTNTGNAYAYNKDFKTPAYNLVKKIRAEEIDKMNLEIAQKQEAFIEKTAIGKALKEAAKVVNTSNPDAEISWKALFLPHYLSKEEQTVLNNIAEERIAQEKVVDDYYNEIYTLLEMAECYDQVEKILKEYKLLMGPKK